MTTVDVRTQSGGTAGSVTLDDAVFGKQVHLRGLRWRDSGRAALQAVLFQVPDQVVHAVLAHAYTGGSS